MYVAHMETLPVVPDKMLFISQAPSISLIERRLYWTDVYL